MIAVQREYEPDFARTRDRGQAYQHLDYYGRVYGRRADCPPLLMTNLRDLIRELGGDPDYVELTQASAAVTGGPRGRAGSSTRQVTLRPCRPPRPRSCTATALT
jgi:hypothetical protein